MLPEVLSELVLKRNQLGGSSFIYKDKGMLEREAIALR
jgi:hypothetical protein